MAQPALNRLFLCLILFCLGSVTAFAKCEEVQFKSEETFKNEKAETCFYNDPTYFLSQNCQDLSCGFIRDLKKIEHEVDSGMRPGAILCEMLGGALESVSYDRVKFEVRRCLFANDKSFISLNLLESWDGQVFRGPSTPIDL